MLCLVNYMWFNGIKNNWDKLIFKINDNMSCLFDIIGVIII